MTSKENNDYRIPIVSTIMIACTAGVAILAFWILNLGHSTVDTEYDGQNKAVPAVEVVETKAPGEAKEIETTEEIVVTAEDEE